MTKDIYELPPGWIWTTLGEVSKMASGGTPRRGIKEYWEGSIPWLKISGIPEDGRVFKTEETITQRGLNESSAKIFPRGTLLFTIFATIGKVGILEIDAATNQAICGIKPEDEVDPKFAFYYLRYAGGSLINRTHGITQKNINMSILKSMQFPLAPRAEQSRIVAKIRSLLADGKTSRQALNKILPVLKRFRQTVLTKAFRGELTQRDPNDEPAEKLLERVRRERQKKWEEDLRAKGKDPKKYKYKEQEPVVARNLAPLPQSWVWTSLSEVCTKIQDGTHFSPPNFTNLKDGVPYITAKNIKPHGVDLSKITYVSKSTHEEIYKRCNPEKGDVLYIKDGATTGLGVINELDFPFTMLSSLALLKPDKRLLNSRFLKHYLNSPEAFRRMTRRMTGTAIKRIILRRIRTAEFPLAPLNEQNCIVTKIDELFSFADQIEESVKKARKRVEMIEQAILVRAFRGELVAQDPNDEPASALLERIRARRSKKHRTTGTKRIRPKLIATKTSLLDFTT